MTPSNYRFSGFSRGPRHQRGMMLIIALIVLVAMTLVGIATMRSVDTASLVAGNIAFKQSTTGGADEGLQAAYLWLSLNATGSQLDNDNGTVGYFSNVPGIEPDWSQDSNWTNGKTLNNGNPDAAGNTIAYIIHRMCPQRNCKANSNSCPTGGLPNPCGQTPDMSAVSGEGSDNSRGHTFTKQPGIHYRITARAKGPRNSVTVVQTMMLIQ